MNTHTHPITQQDAAASVPAGRLARCIGPVALTLVAAFLGACASPYAAPMAQLDADYASGRIGRREYQRRHAALAENDAYYKQEQTRQTIAAANTAVQLIGLFQNVPGAPGGGPGRPGPGRPGPGPGPGPRR